MDLLEVLRREGETRRLRFVVIGGWAVNAYGYSRVTGDIDFLVARRESAAWMGILSEIGYVVRHEGGAFVQMSPPLEGMWPVDLMLVSEPTFESFWAETKDVEVHGVRLRVPSLEHLFALKLHALKHGLPHREAKDFNDLIHLIHSNRLRVDEESFRRLVDKYGTSAVYARIRETVRALPDA